MKLNQNVKTIILIAIPILFCLGVFLFVKKPYHQIEITDELKEELRQLIPTHCGGVDEQLFQEKRINPKKINKKSDDDCTSKGVHVTFHLEKGIETSGEFVYLDDYILIYSIEGEGENHAQWGRQYQKFDSELKVKLKEGDKFFPEIESFQKYGGVYRYTFQEGKDGFDFVAVEPVRS